MTAELVTDAWPLSGRLVADVMSPGCVSVPANATVSVATAALESHDVHAVLVVDSGTCVPLGWITARGQVGGARRHGLAGSAIDEEITEIDRDRSVKAARYALSLTGVSRLLVRSAGSVAPEGVVTERDIARATLRA